MPSWRVDNTPYGGVKDSGLGREGIRWSIRDLTELRLLVVRQASIVVLTKRMHGSDESGSVLTVVT